MLATYMRIACQAFDERVNVETKKVTFTFGQLQDQHTIAMEKQIIEILTLFSGPVALGLKIFSVSAVRFTWFTEKHGIPLLLASQLGYQYTFSMHDHRISTLPKTNGYFSQDSCIWWKVLKVWGQTNFHCAIKLFSASLRLRLISNQTSIQILSAQFFH